MDFLTIFMTHEIFNSFFSEMYVYHLGTQILANFYRPERFKSFLHVCHLGIVKTLESQINSIFSVIFFEKLFLTVN